VQFTITHRGIPLGEVELAATKPINHVDFRPLSAYTDISTVVSQARRAMRGELFLPGMSKEAGEAAFERAMSAWRALNAELELRDAEGRLVPTTAIELLDEEEHSPYWRWTATLVFGEEEEGVPAGGLPPMRCLDCGERDATVIWVEGTALYRNVRRAGDPAPLDEPSVPPVAAKSGLRPRGPNLCEPCAQRRYEASLPAGAPSWQGFTRRG
jgi:hypothetical protein